jgi:uncharacterized MAPEG superfamily protein
MLPHVAKLGIAYYHQGFTEYNNTTPRYTDWEQVFPKGPAMSDLMKRLTSAHANGLEALAFYGPAIALCKMNGVSDASMAPWVTTFLSVRLAYNIVYMLGSTPQAASLRTALFFGGAYGVVQLYILAATGGKQ